MSSSGNPLEPEVTGSWLLSAYAMEDDRSPAVHLRRVEEEKRRSPGGGSYSALEFIPRVSGRSLG